MEAGSEGESNKNLSRSPSADGGKKPKRQMKTPFQLETLEKTYALETYPSETTRAELSEKLGLTDRQLQMWFCHRRLKDKKEAAGMATVKSRASVPVGRKSLMDSPGDEINMTAPGGDHGSRSGSGSGSSQFDNGDDIPMVPIRYYESPRTIMERRVIACVEAQLGEPLREDGPVLGIEFDELPPGAFGAPIVTTENRERFRHSYESKLFGPYDTKQTNAPAINLREPAEQRMRSDGYGHPPPSYLYDSPVDGPSTKTLPIIHGNGSFSREYGVEGQVSSASVFSQPAKQGHFSPSPPDNDFVPHDEDILQMERKGKGDEQRIGREVQSHEKRIRKELEKQDLLRRKREEQIKKEMERQDRERRKEEQKMMREQQRKEERFQREEKREMERREKFLQKELLRAERKKQKEELRREKEAAKQKAAMERATARRIAKESMELVEDERLELMELAASKKGLPSILALDFDTLQNLDSLREFLCEFPPKSVQLKKPFAIQPWVDSEDNIGNLLMAWRFCITFADILGLWPFTLDEFVQAFHDYDTRLLGEIHISLLKMIIKDIEDVVRTPSGGPGTNQYSAANPEGGHPQIVEGAYLWGFDICNWQKHLNPLTWPEILRQFALSAGFGPHLKKKSTEQVCVNDNDDMKGCEDIVSTLRSGSAAENAVAIMQEKGFSLQRRSRHRLTPGTVKFAAYHVLALEGSKGLNVIELADKIQKSGLRDLTTSKTPEASISVALSRDPVLFERIAPSTYCVRPAYRKDPADAEAILSAAREKIQRFVNGFLAGQNAEDEERDDDSECDVADGPEVDDLGIASDANKSNDGNCAIGPHSTNIKENLSHDVVPQNDYNNAGIGESNPDKDGAEIDESKSGKPWVQGLTEGEYSDLCVEERLDALVALIGVANEGNSIRAVLEERLDAANALKKQMWAEAQLDKRRIKEEIVTKFHDSSLNATAEGSQSPLVFTDSKSCEASLTTGVRDEHCSIADNALNHLDNFSAEKSLAAQDTLMSQFTSPIQQSSCTAERSRLQLKSFIGHRAEEIYMYRSLPLGQDRRRNRYWQFIASASSHDPGSGRIFVESPDGHWRLIDSEESFDALFASLDTRGVRESHLHIMLQKIEAFFRTRVRQNLSNATDDNKNSTEDDPAEKSSSPSCSASVDSPNSMVCGMNTDTWEPSSSFRIELGRNEDEQSNALKRYQEFQAWMWKECFNSSILCAMTYGKKGRLPLLRICDHCLHSCLFEEERCIACDWRFGYSVSSKNLSEQARLGEGKTRIDLKNIVVSDTPQPLRIRLLKALLASLEVSVPTEALQSSWTDQSRKTWGSKLHDLSSTEDLLQVLTQFEGVVKRDYLSSNFETTGELLDFCVSSRTSACETAYPAATQLPWIPQTTAAVALRLLEFDVSISYSPQQKSENRQEKKAEDFTKLSLRYGHKMDIHKPELMETDRSGPMEENWNHIRNMPGSSTSRQGVRGRGISRSRGRLQKRPAASLPESRRHNVKRGETLTQVLIKQGETNGPRHVRGRRTLRRRRTVKKVVGQVALNQLGNKGNSNSFAEPRRSVREEIVSMNTERMEPENDDSSNSMEAVESDESAQENAYEFGKWPAVSTDPLNRSNDLMEMTDEDADDSEEDNGYEEEDAENLMGDVDMNDDESDGNEVNEYQGSDSVVSGDYSD